MVHPLHSVRLLAKAPVSFLNTIQFVERLNVLIQESNAMDLRNILSRSSASETAASRPVLNKQSTVSTVLNRGGKTAPAKYAITPRRDLRAVVARRFMLMNEAHDRIRARLLAGYSPGIK